MNLFCFFLPTHKKRKPTTQTAHLQIAQADAQTKICKRAVFSTLQKLIQIIFIRKRIKCPIFAPVKNRIYAISLLLSFLVVLSHEMIIHHHHDSVAVNLLDSQSQVDSPFEKNEEESSTEEHNHPFPIHHHISATSDFVYARTNIQESNPVNKIISLIVVSNLFQTDFFEPPILSINRFRDKSFLISSNYYLAANALRGPPSIV